MAVAHNDIFRSVGFGKKSRPFKIGHIIDKLDLVSCSMTDRSVIFYTFVLSGLAFDARNVGLHVSNYCGTAG